MVNYCRLLCKTKFIKYSSDPSGDQDTFTLRKRQWTYMALVHLLDQSFTTDTFIGCTTVLRRASSPAGPLPGSHCGRVSQPRCRPASGPRGRAASPAVRRRGPGSAWRSTAGRRLSLPPPAAHLDEALRPRPRRTARSPLPTAVEGPAAGRPEAAHPDGPPGTSSARDQLHPPPGAAPQPSAGDVWPRNHRRSFVSFFSSPRDILAPRPMNQFVSCAVPSTTERNGSRYVFFPPHFKVVGCCVYLFP